MSESDISKNSKEESERFFHPRTSVEQVEEGKYLVPKFDQNGLITCVTTDYHSNALLMVGYMNDKALRLSILTSEAHYWSRSRKKLWHKGATSGTVQKIQELYVDDDQDAIWLKVIVAGIGASCHVGYRSCFYRRLVQDKNFIGKNLLEFTDNKKLFDPQKLYGDTENPTVL